MATQLSGKFLALTSSLLGTGVIALLSACTTSDAPTVDATPQVTGNQPALYQQVIDMLLASDDVRPPRPDVFPVHTVYNREAIIPPMCYTRTEGRNNPCYVCHQDALPDRENVMNDANLQAAYSFSDLGSTNHWQNLFIDRSRRAAAIGDDEIRQWINTDNYSELAPRLRESGFKGWIPDLTNLQSGAAAFDSEGFAKDGSHWVAFNYKPFPSTFWPTNGSTDDVMIKLPAAFRSDNNGNYSREIYKANLAILEAKIKGFGAISTLPVDETAVGIDLDGNGKLTVTNHINQLDSYVGAAAGQYIDTYIYPAGTEFLHTVRYLGLSDSGDIQVSTRMKEVRYMKKWKSYPKPVMARFYQEETYAKEAGHLPGYTLLGDYGLDNDSGWSIQSYIENRHGRLRVASYEENLFCMGCHGSIGSTIDKTFSFARKVDGAAGWGYIDLRGMADAPNRGEQRGEIATYFERVGGGDEFRSNTEMLERWFTEDGDVDYKAIAGKDVYQLIAPSTERALQLNKTYRVIVEDQRFLFGRDAVLTPPHNVYRNIDNATTPTLPAEHTYRWDIRLDWQPNSRHLAGQN